MIFDLRIVDDLDKIEGVIGAAKKLCTCELSVSLRKHAYLNILKILQTKKENFQIKNSDIFHIPSFTI